MEVKVPSRDSIGYGKKVACSECDSLHNVGSMITVDATINGNQYIYKVCSVGCLNKLLITLKV